MFETRIESSHRGPCVILEFTALDQHRTKLEQMVVSIVTCSIASRFFWFCSINTCLQFILFNPGKLLALKDQRRKINAAIGCLNQLSDLACIWQKSKTERFDKDYFVNFKS